MTQLHHIYHGPWLPPPSLPTFHSLHLHLLLHPTPHHDGATRTQNYFTGKGGRVGLPRTENSNDPYHSPSPRHTDNDTKDLLVRVRISVGHQVRQRQPIPGGPELSSMDPGDLLHRRQRQRRRHCPTSNVVCQHRQFCWTNLDHGQRQSQRQSS